MPGWRDSRSWIVTPGLRSMSVDVMTVVDAPVMVVPVDDSRGKLDADVTGPALPRWGGLPAKARGRACGWPARFRRGAWFRVLDVH